MERTCPQCGLQQEVDWLDRVDLHEPLTCERCGYEFSGPPPADEAVVDPVFHRRAEPGRRYIEDAYEKAFWQAYYFHEDSQVDDIVLIHGRISRRASTGEIETFGYPWVELPSSVVFDPGYQMFFTKDSYYSAVNAQPEQRYDWQWVKQHVPRRRGEYGPWPAGQPDYQ